MSELPKPTFAHRVHVSIEHGSMQTLLGIVGGLVGVLLDGRYLALLGLWPAYSLYRSNSLEGLSKRTRVSVYASSILVAALCLFVVGIAVNKSRPHTYTPSDYATAFKNNTPLPITQQVTNVYNNTYKQIRQEATGSGTEQVAIENQELRVHAFTLAFKIRAIDYELENSVRVAHSQPTYEPEWKAYDEAKAKWTPLRAETRLLIDNMTSRIPPDQIHANPIQLYAVQSTVDVGSLAGNAPLLDVSTYLETLAQLLPNSVAQGKH